MWVIVDKFEDIYPKEVSNCEENITNTSIYPISKLWIC